MKFWEIWKIALETEQYLLSNIPRLNLIGKVGKINTDQNKFSSKHSTVFAKYFHKLAKITISPLFFGELMIYNI